MAIDLDIPIDEFCFSAAVKKYPEFDDTTLVEIGKKLNAIDAKFADNPFKLIQEKVKLYDEIELSYKQIVRSSKQNKLILNKKLKYVRDSQFLEYPEEALRTIVEGTNRFFVDGRKSIDGMAEAQYNMTFSSMINELKEKGVLEFVIKGENDPVIIDELKRMNEPDYKPSSDPRVVNTADVLKKVNDGLYNMMTAAGVEMPYLKDWVNRNTWDAVNMLGKEKDWIAFGFKHFDLERMFPDVQGKRRRLALKKMYDGIIERTLSYHTENTAGKSRSLLKNFESNRVIHFKNSESHSLAMKEWGYGTLFANLENTIDMYSRRSAAFTELGTEPIATFDKLAKDVADRNKDLKGLKSKIDATRANLQAAIYGPRRGTTSAYMVSQVLKDLNDITLLGKLGITGGTGDLASSVANDIASGDGMLKAFANNISTFFQSLPSETVQQVAKEYSVVLDIGQADLISSLRETREDGIRSATWRKLKDIFAKMSGGVWQFKQSRTTRMITWGRKLADNVKLSYSELDDNIKNIFIENGITEEYWNIARTAKVNKTLGLTIESLHNIPLSAFEGNSEDMSPFLFKQKMLMDFNRYLHNQLNDDVPVPKLKEKRRMGANIDPDSFWGIVASLTTQFKGVPLKMMGTTARNLRRSSGTNNLGKAIISTNGMTLAGRMAIPLIGMAYANMAIRAIIAGEDLPDPSDQKTWEMAISASGTFGLWGDLMLGEYEKIYRDPVKDLGGPTASRVGDILTLLAKIRAGEDISSTAASQIIRAIPGNNLWFIPGALRRSLIEAVKEGI